MDVFSGFTELKKINSSVITIGSFDGMHRGHIDIIYHTNYISKNKNIPSVAITFDPHPQSVLKNKYNEYISTNYCYYTYINNRFYYFLTNGF